MSSAAVVEKLGFAERIVELVQKIRYRQALTTPDREAIFRLRYEGYRRDNTIPPDFSRRFSDDFDNLENAWLFGVYVDGVLASTIRLHVLSAKYPTSPAAKIYPELINPFLDAGQVIIDPNRFVVDPAAARAYPELHYMTLRLCVLASEYFHADQTLATVRTNHQAFYKRIFGHRLISEPRYFPKVADPIFLMSTNFPEIREGMYRRFPFFHSTEEERRLLFNRPENWLPVSPEELTAA